MQVAGQQNYFVRNDLTTGIAWYHVSQLHPFVTKDEDSRHRILQEPAATCGKNHRILKEKTRNHWKTEAVFLPGNFLIFACDFRPFPLGNGWKLPEKNPKISG